MQKLKLKFKPKSFLLKFDSVKYFLNWCIALYGIPCGSAGKESACNVGDLGSIPGLGRSFGEEIGYPLQYSWAFLVAQSIKNPPATLETCVRSLCQEDPLEKGKATWSSTLA